MIVVVVIISAEEEIKIKVHVVKPVPVPASKPLNKSTIKSIRPTLDEKIADEIKHNRITKPEINESTPS